jgi:hypothetical protein
MQAELDELLALYRSMEDEQKQELIKSAQEIVKQQQNQTTD